MSMDKEGIQVLRRAIRLQELPYGSTCYPICVFMLGCRERLYYTVHQRRHVKSIKDIEIHGRYFGKNATRRPLPTALSIVRSDRFQYNSDRYSQYSDGYTVQTFNSCTGRPVVCQCLVVKHSLIAFQQISQAHQ